MHDYMLDKMVGRTHFLSSFFVVKNCHFLYLIALKRNKVIHPLQLYIKKKGLCYNFNE